MADETMKAPFISGMSKLEETQTVVLRQLTQYAEFFLPYEQQNKYMLTEVPSGVRAATSVHDPDAWHPTGQELRDQPSFLFGYEMSGFCTRCLYRFLKCANQRPFEFNFVPSYKMQELDAAGELISGYIQMNETCLITPQLEIDNVNMNRRFEFQLIRSCK